MKKLLLVKLSLILFLFVKGSTVYAQSYDSYVWQYLNPQNVTNVDDLKVKLESEVNKVVKAGHLAPFFTNYGKWDPEIDWYHAYDTVYTLSLVYPYVSVSTQTAIKNYLQSEMAAYPVWSNLINPTTGFKRQPDNFYDANNYLTEVRSSYDQYSTRPKLFALYALWLYAQNTGDWSYVQNNWSSITSFYSSNRSETSKYYSSIAGAIGMARLAAQKISPDLTLQNQAVSDVNTGMGLGRNLDAFGLNSENAFKWMSKGGDWDYTKENFYFGYQFLDISPEIGRYLYDDSALRNSVLGSSGGSIYSLSTGLYRYYYWWIAQAPYFGKVYAEDSATPPMLKAMIFPIKAWVQKDPVSKLRQYLDVPDALVGDYYYIQNLTRVIELSGTPCWKDIKTGVCY